MDVNANDEALIASMRPVPAWRQIGLNASRAAATLRLKRQLRAAGRGSAIDTPISLVPDATGRRTSSEPAVSGDTAEDDRTELQVPLEPVALDLDSPTTLLPAQVIEGIASSASAASSQHRPAHVPPTLVPDTDPSMRAPALPPRADLVTRRAGLSNAEFSLPAPTAVPMPPASVEFGESVESVEPSTEAADQAVAATAIAPPREGIEEATHLTPDALPTLGEALPSLRMVLVRSDDPDTVGERIDDELVVALTIVSDDRSDDRPVTEAMLDAWGIDADMAVDVAEAQTRMGADVAVETVLADPLDTVMIETATPVASAWLCLADELLGSEPAEGSIAVTLSPHALLLTVGPATHSEVQAITAFATAESSLRHRGAPTAVLQYRDGWWSTVCDVSSPGHRLRQWLRGPGERAESAGTREIDAQLSSRALEFVESL